ncbi:EamA family transporter [soil metagenome]
MWLPLAFGSAIFASLVAVFGKLGLKNIDSTLATTIRATIMAIFLIGLSLILKKFDGFNLHTLGGKDWTLIILSGIAGAISWLFYFAALKYGLASHVASIDRLSLVFIVVLSILFLGEGFDWKVVGGAILMVVGAVIITL